MNREEFLKELKKRGVGCNLGMQLADIVNEKDYKHVIRLYDDFPELFKLYFSELNKYATKVYLCFSKEDFKKLKFIEGS